MEISIDIDEALFCEGYTKVVRCRNCEYVKRIDNTSSWDGNHILYVCTRKVYKFQITGDDYCCIGRKRK